jgi:multimeric flavodoxin WrbA
MQRFHEFAKDKSKKKVVLVVGSARNSDCCPNEKSKTHKLADKIRAEFSELVNFEVVDLSVKCDGVNVQPCKGCVSTSNMHCRWPCDCYGKQSDPKDLMHKEDVYRKLEACDGFFVLTPINWSSCSSVVKSFFDRLVCANLTITANEAVEIFGKDHIKDSKATREAEKSGKYNEMLRNHLEGKVAGFFAHGNDGGADYIEFAKKKTKALPVIPESMKEYEKSHGKEDSSKVLDPLVRQCVYSGIRVPDDCVRVVTYGFGISYGDSNDLFEKEAKLKKDATEVFESFLGHLSY